MVHAGLLLLKARDEDALPVFVQGFRRTDIDPFGEWFGEKLRLYGPAAVPALTELLHDEEADVWGRMEAARKLSPIAWAPPDAGRDSVGPSSGAAHAGRRVPARRVGRDRRHPVDERGL